MTRTLPAILAAAAMLAGCAQTPPIIATLPPSPPRTDRLVTPDSADMAHLHYTSHYETFPPVMTERRAYPTQDEASTAFERSRWSRVQFPTTKGGAPYVITASTADDTDYSTSIRLFACKPGALDGITGRVISYRGPVVVCASDLLDAAGGVLAREPLNFYYYRRAWHVQDPEPSYTPARWRNHESSPPNSPWWNPWSDRY